MKNSFKTQKTLKNSFFSKKWAIQSYRKTRISFMKKASEKIVKNIFLVSSTSSIELFVKKRKQKLLEFCIIRTLEESRKSISARTVPDQQFRSNESETC
jgi:hypothetical protein